MDDILISYPSESTAYIGYTSSEELFNFSFSCIVWCKLTFILVFWAICAHILISPAHLLIVMSGQIT
jgi:hypothetical protein